MKVHDSRAVEALRECLWGKGKRAQTRAAGGVRQRARRSEGDWEEVATCLEHLQEALAS